MPGAERWRCRSLVAGMLRWRRRRLPLLGRWLASQPEGLLSSEEATAAAAAGEAGRVRRLRVRRRRWRRGSGRSGRSDRRLPGRLPGRLLGRGLLRSLVQHSLLRGRRPLLGCRAALPLGHDPLLTPLGLRRRGHLFIHRAWAS
eukprot:scaffold63495_cov39-Phaeocystis_antarctica.AAC.1